MVVVMAMVHCWCGAFYFSPRVCFRVEVMAKKMVVPLQEAAPVVAVSGLCSESV